MLEKKKNIKEVNGNIKIFQNESMGSTLCIVSEQTLIFKSMIERKRGRKG